MAALHWSREITSLLLENYAQYPCLYAVGNGDYHNRTKRSEVYNIIVNNLRRYRPQTTIHDVKTKINSLRTQFNLENTKVLRSQVHASTHDEVYQPTLWCFDQMQFLKQHVCKRRNHAPSFELNDHIDEDEDDIQIVPPKDEIDDEPTIDPHVVSGFPLHTSLQTNTPPPSSPEDKIISTTTNTLNTTNPLTYLCESAKSQVVIQNDQYDNFSRFVASELRTITDHDIFIQTKRKIQMAILDAQEAQESRRLSSDRHLYYLPSPSNSNLSLENYYGNNSSSHDSISKRPTSKSSKDISKCSVSLI